MEGNEYTHSLQAEVREDCRRPVERMMALWLSLRGPNISRRECRKRNSYRSLLQLQTLRYSDPSI